MLVQKEPLLTIAVPTFNRAANLRCLLECLRVESEAIRNEIAVLVLDNASGDDTPKVLADYSDIWPHAEFKRHAINIGGDANVAECAYQCRTKYLWVIGDDDLLMTGALVHVLDLLRKESPDLIYLPSAWTPKIEPGEHRPPIVGLSYDFMGRATFARRVNVWFTFISGVVVNRELVLAAAGKPAIKRYLGSHFVQLGWVLNALKFGSQFICVNDVCVVATSNNSGGYGLSTVFGVNFATIVSDVFGPDAALSRILIRRNLICFLPGLVWQSRFQIIGDFKAESPWPQLRRALDTYSAFWLLVLPIARLPRGIAWLFFQGARVISKLVKTYDRAATAASARVSGTRRRLEA
jgi:abequosyltransferase